MARAFLLPDLGEGLTEGEVARWLVTEGQVVAEDEPLVEIQTDKATVEIPSPYAGTVLKIVVPEGEVAPVGARLVVIGEPGEAIDEPTPEAPSGSEPQGAALRRPRPRPDRAQATPLVRKIASRARGGSRHRLCDRSRAGASPRTTCARRPAAGQRRRDGASRCAGSAA